MVVQPAAESGEPEPEDKAREKMLCALKRAAVGELTGRQKECVALYYARGLSQAETAKYLGITVATVSRHLKKARTRLRRVLEYYR